MTLRVRSTTLFVGAALAAALLADCSGAASSATPAAIGAPAGTVTLSRATRDASWLAPEAKAKNASLLYELGYAVVSSQDVSAIYVYDAKKPFKQVGTIANPALSGASRNIFVDGSENLYVSAYGGGSSGNGYVVEFPKGNSNPSFTYTGQLTAPQYVAVDKSGTVYVANALAGYTSGDIVEFPQGSNTPSFTIPASSLPSGYFPVAVGVDSKSNVYVSLYAGGVTQIWEFPPQSTKGKNLKLLDLRDTSSTSLFTDKHGNLVIAAGFDTVNLYAPGQTAASKTMNLQGEATSIQLALNKSESTLYASGVVPNPTYPGGTQGLSYLTGLVKSSIGQCWPSGAQPAYCGGVAVDPPASIGKPY
jgi:hypothetical protein